jgi:PGDYG protein
MVKYIKKPIPTLVEFARHAGTLQTREGLVAYEAGDALMTGIVGERWPIRRARFEATYEPILPTRMGDTGEYLKKPAAVSAVQAESEQQIQLAGDQGMLSARKSDWIVTSEDGSQWVVADEIFQASYQAVGE